MTAPLAPWVARWIGLPFLLGGRGPAGFDCWGLVRAAFHEQSGILLPSCDEAYGELPAEWRDRNPAIARAMAGGPLADWRPIAARRPISAPLAWTERPRVLDGVTLRRGADLCHVGLIVGVDRRGRATMLHTEEGVDSHITPLDGPDVHHQVVGVWRHTGLDPPDATTEVAPATARAAP